MQPLLILAGILFLALPLPICIYLLVKRSKDSKRIQTLEIDLERFAREQTQSPASAISEPPPRSAIAATKSPEPESPAPLSPELPLEPTSDPVEAGLPRDPHQANRDPSLAGPLQHQADTPPQTPPPIPSTLSGAIAFLRSIGLWPPEDSASAEAGIMQWWLPRLGGLLAVLSVVSGAVYISQSTPPWVRFIELLVADAAVLGVGIFFLKRRPRFGAILTSTGLSMVYLTSIAAYSAPPVRVIENPLLGIFIQFAVVGGILLISLRLANRNVAIMALVYGFLSSIFSAYVGLLESSLISALALYIVGIVFSRKFKWLPMLAVSTVGAYLPVLSFCALNVIQSTTLTLPHTWSVLVSLMLTVSLLPFCEVRWKLAKSLNIPTSLHTLNTTTCLGIGYLYMRFFANDLVAFYGIATLVFAAWAILFGFRNLNSALFQLFFLKASALAALWFVNRFAGDIRWFALIVEAALVAWIALRSKSLLQEFASIALWVVSLGIALSSMGFHMGFEKLPIGSFSWWLFLAHPLIAAAVLAYLKRGRDSDHRFSGFYRILAIVNGLAGVRFIVASDLIGDAQPIATGIYGAVICALCFIPLFANSIPAISGALLILVANIQYWDNPYNDISFVVSAILAFSAAWGIARNHGPRASIAALLAELLFHATWTISLYAYLANAFQSQAWFIFIPAALSLGLLVLPTGPFKALRETSLVPLFIFATTDLAPQISSSGRWIATLLYLFVLYLPTLKPNLIRGFHLLRPKRVWRTLQHLLVAFILIRVAFEFESWLGRVLIFLVLALAFHFLWRFHKRLIALLLSIGSLGLSLLSIASIWSDGLSGLLEALPWAREALTGGLLTTAVALAIGIDHARSSHRSLSNRARQGLAYLTAIIAFATIAVTLSSDLLWNESSYTPLIALFCLILVGIGIGAKIKPYRMVALAGFALPLARLFIYDIRDTLIRIIAFAILSVLLMFVGYLYHRFQSRIE